RPTGRLRRLIRWVDRPPESGTPPGSYLPLLPSDRPWPWTGWVDGAPNVGHPVPPSARPTGRGVESGSQSWPSTALGGSGLAFDGGDAGRPEMLDALARCSLSLPWPPPGRLGRGRTA